MSSQIQYIGHDFDRDSWLDIKPLPGPTGPPADVSFSLYTFLDHFILLRALSIIYFSLIRFVGVLFVFFFVIFVWMG